MRISDWSSDVCSSDLLTDSRLGVVGYCLSFLFYLFIHGLIKWRSERRSLVGPAIILAYPLLFTGFIVSTFFVQRLNRMVWGGGAASYSTQARIEQYQKGLGLVMENPLGYGIGRGSVTLGFTNPEGVETIDTYYLLILLEYGVLGFLIFYGLFLTSSEEHTSELQSLMRISYAVFCLKKTYNKRKDKI